MKAVRMIASDSTEADSRSIEPPSSPGQTDASSRTRFQDRPETILLVEDDPAVREMTRFLLHRSGFNVLVADSNIQAQWIWGRQRDQIDLLLTDIMIPNQSTGVELAKKFQSERPHLPVVYMSGFGREIGEGDTAHLHRAPFLRKPFSPSDLIEAVAFSLAVARSRKGDLS